MRENCVIKITAAAGSAYGVIGHTRGVDIAGRCEKR
ncbi:hypothetical protein HMPREF1006_02120 [Synergistes sp. 3_1_syn1]|nr:hypothetical protein HMPREF1006_02120 [Synergistes sp. 3_1_syn1]